MFQAIYNWMLKEHNIKVLIWLTFLCYFYLISALTKERVLIFIIIWILIYLYVLMHKLMDYFLEKPELQLRLKLNMYIRNNKESFQKLNIVLMKFNNLRNPFIILFSSIDKILFILYKNCNYIIIKNKIKIKKQTLLNVYLLINLICLGLLKCIFLLLYNIIIILRHTDKGPNLYNESELYTLHRIFIKNQYGVVSMVLIFTNIIPIILSMSLQNYIVIYVVFSIMLILLNNKYEAKKEYADNLITDTWKNKVIKKVLELIFIYSDSNVYSGFFLKNHRNHLMLLGQIIDYINLNLTVSKCATWEKWEQENIYLYKELELEEKNVEEPEGLKDSIEQREIHIIASKNDKSISLQSIQYYEEHRKMITEMLANNNIKSLQGCVLIAFRAVHLKNRINFKYFYDLGGYGSYLEINFLYLWLTYKYNKCCNNYYIEKSKINNEILNEIKHYPSWFLYHFIFDKVLFYTQSSFFIQKNNMYAKNIVPLTIYMDMLYFEYKITENLNILLELEEVEKVLNILKFSIKFEKSRIKLFFFMLWDIESCLDIDNYNYEYWKFDKGDTDGLYYLKLTEHDQILTAFNNFKKENAFYDLDQNLDFFIKVFKYVYIIDENFNRQLVQFLNKNEIQYFVGEELELYSKAILFIKYKFAKININRFYKSNDNGFVEETIKAFTYNYLKEIRKEWENSEEGNLKIIKEFNNLENIYLDYKSNKNLTDLT